MKTNIRRSDQHTGLNLFLKDIKPEILMKVFKLKNVPDYLESENGDIFVFPIDTSKFPYMDSYLLDAPGTTSVVATKS